MFESAMISKGEQAESVSFIAESSGHCLTIGKLHLQAGLNVDGVKFALAYIAAPWPAWLMHSSQSMGLIIMRTDFIE